MWIMYDSYHSKLNLHLQLNKQILCKQPRLIQETKYSSYFLYKNEETVLKKKKKVKSKKKTQVKY